jgi:hypothetical protein
MRHGELEPLTDRQVNLLHNSRHGFFAQKEVIVDVSTHDESLYGRTLMTGENNFQVLGATISFQGSLLEFTWCDPIHRTWNQTSRRTSSLRSSLQIVQLVF